MSSGLIVTFNDPRRFGLMDLLTPRQLAAHATLSKLGPEPLSAAFDAARTRQRLSRQEDVAQSGAAGSTRRRRAGQHLRGRSAVPRPALAAAPGLDDRHAVRRAAAGGVPAGCRDQEGARGRGRSQSKAIVSRTGSGSTTAPASAVERALHRIDRAAHAGRPHERSTVRSANDRPVGAHWRRGRTGFVSGSLSSTVSAGFALSSRPCRSVSTN